MFPSPSSLFFFFFQNQAGWRDTLQRFVDGDGQLYDLEFLNFPDGRRVAAFGVSAGFVGMAIGIMAWCQQQLHPSVELKQVDYFDSFTQLLSYCRQLLEKASAVAKRKPRAIVIGALGRCGRGTVQVCEGVGVEVTKWDLEETKKGGPFPELLDYDIVVNSIFLSSPIPPFITPSMLDNKDRRMSVLVDVSCDTSNPHNPIPVYKECTTFNRSSQRIIQPTDNSLPLDIVAIDHLPSLVPAESSKEYAASLFPHLLEFPVSSPWEGAIQLFRTKTADFRKSA
jgi:saccharopine dehydrogenase (NAD+, L-lysine-forming)